MLGLQNNPKKFSVQKQTRFFILECTFFGFELNKKLLVNIYAVYIKISKFRVFSLGLTCAAKWE